MTRRALAAYLGALICLAWAVLTAWAYLRSRPVTATLYPDDAVQPWDQRSVTLASGYGEWVN